MPVVMGQVCSVVLVGPVVLGLGGSGVLGQDWSEVLVGPVLLGLGGSGVLVGPEVGEPV